MNELFNAEATRRGFFARGAMLTAGVAAGSLLLAQGANATPTLNLGIPTTAINLPGSGDTQVLNYALTLEDLEADLYAQALSRLTTGGNTGTQASASVGTIPPLNLTANDATYGPLVTYVSRFLAVERAHRDFLKQALGNNAITVTAPKKYAFGIEAMSPIQVLNLVLEAEATGVQAYLGAVPFFSTGSPYLSTAAAIQGTEARHTSVLTIVRNVLYVNGAQTADPITPVAPLRGDTGGSPQSTTGESHGSSTYVEANPNLGDANGIDLYLTPTEVVNRVAGFIKTS